MYHSLGYLAPKGSWLLALGWLTEYWETIVNKMQSLCIYSCPFRVDPNITNRRWMHVIWSRKSAKRKHCLSLWYWEVYGDLTHSRWAMPQPGNISLYFSWLFLSVSTCVCLYTLVVPRDWHQVSSSVPSHCRFWDQNSHQFGKAGWLASARLLFPLPQHWDYKHTPTGAWLLQGG